jgi:hypothetical protein
MSSDTIERSDVLGWDSKEDVAETLEKRGLERTKLGEEDEIVMVLDDDRFIAIVSADSDRKPSDYNKRMTATRKTQVVSTDDFEEFTFTTRRRAIDRHGQLNYRRWRITKDQFRNSSEINTPLNKLNEIEYGDPSSIEQLYETKKVVDKFYKQFESLRAEIVQKVSGIPDDEGDNKQDYAQTIFDRLIFLHFIQEKKLLDYNTDYLEEQQQKAIEEGEDVYEEFYRPLFFDWLATDREHPEHSLPYLNGGLFAKTDVEKEYDNIQIGENKQETNQLFSKILDFLGDWNWHADERLDIVDKKRLSPELLGHIFEKTVNQKEMGAYYTPEEITDFMSRNTIQPFILDRINGEFDRDYDNIDELFKISERSETGEEVVIGPVKEIERDEVEYLFFEVLNDVKVLDPAVGSGAFLLAAQQVLIDIYLSCIQYFEELDREASYRLTSRAQDVLQEIGEEGGRTNAKKSMYAKRQIILNNLYGVDIDKGATEICKLRLWLSIVADLEKGDDPRTVETLPNIDFNIRQGNTLIGFTEPVEKALEDKVDDENSQLNLNQYGPNAIQEKYSRIINKVKTYKQHQEEGSQQKAKQARQEAFDLLEKYREDPDEKILQQFHEAGIEDVGMDDIKEFSPFHWVLEFAEVYSGGGFDVIIGNPPWDRIKPNREDYFPKYDELFRTRMPEEKDEKQKELLEDDEIAEGWEEYKHRMNIRADFYHDSSDYKLQKPKVDGRTVGTENDLSSLFFERVFNLSKENGYISQILPGAVYVGASGKDLRLEMIENRNLQNLALYENRGIFGDIDNRYLFGVSVLKNKGSTDEVDMIYSQGDVSLLKNFEDNRIPVSQKLLKNYSPEARIIPLIRSNKDAKVLEKIIKHNSVSEEDGAWYAEPYREIDRTTDRDRFIEDQTEGDYPIYGGSNIHQFNYDSTFYDLDEPNLWSVEENKDPDKSAKLRVREKKLRNLKRELYDEFDGTGSQKSFVNDLLNKKRGKKLSVDDVRLDSSEYRLVYRNVARATDERTMISSIIPKGVICHNVLHTIKSFDINPSEEDLEDDNLKNTYERIFSDRELMVATGLINSLAFDYIIRTKVDSTIVMYKFTETQVPKLTEGDNWFNFISERAAKLNCYGEEFEEMRERLGGIEPATDMGERKRIQAEIDAAAFHAYGLDREETKYVLDNFHKVNNPRLMTEDYFDVILEKFDELDEEGPLE